MLKTWYDEAGNAYLTQPEKLDRLHETMKEALKTLDLKPPKRAELIRFIQAQEENETFKKLVTNELGNRFFDWTDQSGKAQDGLFSYYNGLDPDSKRRFRKENADEYDVISSYYDMRETYAEENVTWADYYGLETVPTAKLPEGEENLTLAPPNPQGVTYSNGKPAGGDKGKGTSKPAARTEQANPYSGDRYVPQFYVPDRTGNYISAGLFSIVGQKMSWEIQEVMKGNRSRISSGGQSFLRSVASRYPEYQSEVAKILAK